MFTHIIIMATIPFPPLWKWNMLNSIRTTVGITTFNIKSKIKRYLFDWVLNRNAELEKDMHCFVAIIHCSLIETRFYTIKITATSSCSKPQHWPNFTLCLWHGEMQQQRDGLQERFAHASYISIFRNIFGQILVRIAVYNEHNGVWYGCLWNKKCCYAMPLVVGIRWRWWTK